MPKAQGERDSLVMQAAMAATADDLTEEQSIECIDAFKNFDKDNTDCISTTDLLQLLEGFGLQLSDAEFGAMAEELDPEGTGKIQLDKYLGLMASKLRPSGNLNGIRDAFKGFDKSKNGTISTKEFMHAMKTFCGDQMPAEVLEQFVKEADDKNSGFIDYEKFIQKMIK